MSATTETRPVLQPGPDHPISISGETETVRIRAGGGVIADQARAVALKEARYPVALYVRREDVPAAALERSDHTSWCPFKGEASYFHLLGADGVRLDNAVWTYETPLPTVEAIRDRLAFYPDKAQLEQL